MEYIASTRLRAIQCCPTWVPILAPCCQFCYILVTSSRAFIPARVCRRLSRPYSGREVRLEHPQPRPNARRAEQGPRHRSRLSPHGPSPAHQRRLWTSGRVCGAAAWFDYHMSQSTVITLEREVCRVLAQEGVKKDLDLIAAGTVPALSLRGS